MYLFLREYFLVFQLDPAAFSVLQNLKIRYLYAKTTPEMYYLRFSQSFHGTAKNIISSL